MQSVFRLLARVAFVPTAAFQAQADITLVAHSDSWRYHKGTNQPPMGMWQTNADAALDTTWLTGNGGVGYADNTPETVLCQTILSDMRSNYSTFYMHKTFTVPSGVDTNLHLQFTMDFDDGFIAWLDGIYLTNRFVTGAPAEPVFNATANTSHESSHGNSSPQPAETYDFGPVGNRLPTGSSHVLAILGLNQSLTASSDFIQIADLFIAAPPPFVTNVWQAANSPIVVTTNVPIPLN